MTSTVILLRQCVQVRILPTVKQTKLVQWIERPPGVWEVIGSIPVGDPDFFFVPRSCHIDCPWAKDDGQVEQISSFVRGQ